MRRWLIWFPLHLLRWLLAFVGAVALLLAAMIATPLAHPPELKSISQTARNVDRSNMPALERFAARDGTLVGYFFIGGLLFLLWMAAVNGGGLILSGFWMRWGE